MSDKNKLETIAAAFKNYVEAVYEGPLIPRQQIEVERAFYAGVIWCFGQSATASTLPEPHGSFALSKILDELEEYGNKQEDDPDDKTSVHKN